ncbi:uncharacterized protein LOC116308465 [Actinia tenebrosa]|uniref:Uncharacterized protein LOC116308465 n=1 Tax=Actinia tenebrosa TaxID=6105 RepID=A0A6P8J503_ACTTE|nr:uncharacterized protein LOC116308465 [Actinia tenebrosa]
MVVIKISMFWAAFLFVIFSSHSNGLPSNKAVPLLSYNEITKKFELNSAGVALISSLAKPIQVTSAVGDARVGKSTSLNMVHHLWNETKDNNFKEIFETGSTFVPVTRGVWISVIHGKERMERVLLDVEGTDLGNDAVTDHLSIFTALMSSGMTFFMKDAVKTHAIDFLYRVSRLSEHIFKDEAIKYFPRLRVVLRGALDTPDGIRMDEYVKDALISPTWKDGSDDKRKAIGKHFPRDHIEVSTIEALQNRKIFKNFDLLSKNAEYMLSIHQLANDLNKFHIKKTLSGGMMDGATLAELAIKLTETMNSGKWLDFGNVYLMVEKHLCDRRYKEIVQPQIGGNSTLIKRFLEVGFLKYEQECALKDYVNATKSELKRIANMKEELEEKQRKLEKETKKRIEEEQKRIKAQENFEQEKEKMEKEVDEAKKNSENIQQEANKWGEKYRAMNAEIERLNNEVKRAYKELEDMQDDGGFFGFLSSVVDTVIKIVLEPVRPLLGNNN